MTELKRLKLFAKEKGIKLSSDVIKAAKATDCIRKIIKDAGIDVKKEFDPNRPYR
jgi:hypothetical protein